MQEDSVQIQRAQDAAAKDENHAAKIASGEGKSDDKLEPGELVGENEKVKETNGKTPALTLMTTPDKPVVKPMNVRRLSEEWRIVGGQRRASATAASPSTVAGAYFAQNHLSAINEHVVAENAITSPYTPSLQSANGQTPVFELYGGRMHGQRSFSFSSGSSADDMKMLNAPPGIKGDPAPSPWARRASAGFNYPNGEMSPDVQMMMMQNPFVAVPNPQHRFLYQPLLDEAQRQQLLHRRVSTYNGPNNYLKNKIPQENVHNVADKYFNQDPSLHQRRHSIATAMVQQSNGKTSPEHPRSSDDSSIPENFVKEYGNLLDDSTTPAVPMFAAPMPNLSLSGFYVIEFKAGRTEMFYSDPSANSFNVGDLVIVEADRGFDLGKISEINSVAEDVTPDDVSRILRLARPNEVNQLIDKARDEEKALKVIKAKVQQKGYPMEVIDAEYQHDKKRLTFYFVAESRVDFRDLVKDLFKIFKTRIWMCSMDKR
ncbi:hypothetical protein MP228_007381 [Amoeboaphelidium protococcarum]|nr:hypothetical protein MP228_007381 [Amoeboaphelidium protococcarum]